MLWTSRRRLTTRVFFFFNDTATTEIYTLSLHDALPIWLRAEPVLAQGDVDGLFDALRTPGPDPGLPRGVGRESLDAVVRSEEHTSELQSRQYLVCRLLLEKKNTRPFRCPAACGPCARVL